MGTSRSRSLSLDASEQVLIEQLKVGTLVGKYPRFKIVDSSVWVKSGAQTRFHQVAHFLLQRLCVLMAGVKINKSKNMVNAVVLQRKFSLSPNLTHEIAFTTQLTKLNAGVPFAPLSHVTSQ